MNTERITRLKTRRLARRLRTIDINKLKKDEMKGLIEGTKLRILFETPRNWGYATNPELKAVLQGLKDNLPNIKENQNENEYNNNEYVAPTAGMQRNTPSSSNSQQITPGSKGVIQASRARRVNRNTVKMAKYDMIIKNPNLFKKQWRGDSIFQGVLERKYGRIYGDKRPHVAMTRRQEKLVDVGLNNRCTGNKIQIFNHEHGASARGGRCCSLFENGEFAHSIGEGPVEGTGKICGWVYSGNKVSGI
jgi:hypothetical protein